MQGPDGEQQFRAFFSVITHTAVVTFAMVHKGFVSANLCFTEPLLYITTRNSRTTNSLNVQRVTD
jgi:hypothetical protein